jgi:hypothetical protein
LEAEMNQITDRDIDIITALAKLRALNTDQITWLFFGSPITARARLLVLERRKLIQRIHPLENHHSAWGYWTLARGGLGLRELNPCPITLSPILAEHQLGLNWVYCRLVGQGGNLTSKVVWEDGSMFRFESGSERIRPDARVMTGARTVLVEYDRRTKSMPVVNRNLWAYWKWLANDLPPDPTTLLYSVPDVPRAQAIIEEWYRLQNRFEASFGIMRLGKILERVRFLSARHSNTADAIREKLGLPKAETKVDRRQDGSFQGQSAPQSPTQSGYVQD